MNFSREVDTFIQSLSAHKYLLVAVIFPTSIIVFYRWNTMRFPITIKFTHMISNLFIEKILNTSVMGETII